jgi:hypothetical protein
MSADLFEAFSGSTGAHATKAPVTLNKNKVTTGSSAAASVLSSRSLPQTEPLWRSERGGNDVLFDAEDEATQNGIDDDFGDFEDAGAPSPPEHSLAKTKPSEQVARSSLTSGSIDLLGLDESPVQYAGVDQYARGTATPPVAPFMNTSDTLVDDSWGDFEGPTETVPTDPKSTSSDTAHHEAHAANDSQAFGTAWDAFEDGPAHTSDLHGPASLRQRTVVLSEVFKSSSARKTESSVAEPPEEDAWDEFIDQPVDTKEQASAPAPRAIPVDLSTQSRPSNVPPPSVLFSWLTKIYVSLSSSATSPTAILQVHRLSGRILAGRAQRWRRDTLLSQSLRISDMSLGNKQSGMKLSSLSKSESQREAREASETVAAWNARFSTFTSVLRKQNVVLPKETKLRLSEPLAIKVLKSEQGGMDANYICPVCGLKRNERVLGVDDNGVEDVFGDYWKDGWGHKDCASAWYEYNELLSQR